MSNINHTIITSPRDEVSESRAISSTAATEIWTVDILNALKDAKSGDHSTQPVTTTDIPETTSSDKNDTGDKPESVKSNASLEGTTDTTEQERTPALPNVTTPATN